MPFISATVPEIRSAHRLKNGPKRVASSSSLLPWSQQFCDWDFGEDPANELKCRLTSRRLNSRIAGNSKRSEALAKNHETYNYLSCGFAVRCCSGSEPSTASTGGE